MEERYPNIQFSQFMGAEMMAKKYGLTKDQLDEYGFGSHQKAIAATQGGRFKDEIVPLEITTRRRQDASCTRSTRASASTSRLDGDQGREAAAGRRRDHRRDLQPDLRRRLGRDGGQRRGPEGASASSRWPASTT